MKEQISTYTRARSVIELAGTPFYVDAQYLYLVEVADPANKIDMHDARSFKDHTELWYDATIKNVFRGSYNQLPNEHIHVFYFHSFSALDPVGAAALLDELNPDWRADLDTDLPVVDIAGRLFLIDQKAKCFSEVNNCWNWISFNQIVTRENGIGLYINLNRHDTPFLFELKDALSAPALPAHIVFAPIPKGTKAKKIIDQYFRQKR